MVESLNWANFRTQPQTVSQQPQTQVTQNNATNNTAPAKPLESPKKKTNLGKYIGMPVGALSLGAYTGINIKKVLADPQFKEIVNMLVSSDLAAKFEIPTKEFEDIITKIMKMGAKALPVIVGVVGLFAGLGIGAIVDATINHVRNKKAQKVDA